MKRNGLIESYQAVFSYKDSYFSIIRRIERMERLRNTEAAEVFRFFEEICRIPHGSGNVGQSSYCLAQLARDRHLE